MNIIIGSIIGLLTFSCNSGDNITNRPSKIVAVVVLLVIVAVVV